MYVCASEQSIQTLTTLITLPTPYSHHPPPHPPPPHLPPPHPPPDTSGPPHATYLQQQDGNDEGEALTVANLQVIHRVGLADLLYEVPGFLILEVSVSHKGSVHVPLDDIPYLRG